MRRLVPCLGKTACRDDDRQCLTCGRGFPEIEQTRALIDALAGFALAQDYDNVAEFANYIAHKVEKKVHHCRSTRMLEDSKPSRA